MFWFRNNVHPEHRKILCETTRILAMIHNYSGRRKSCVFKFTIFTLIFRLKLSNVGKGKLMFQIQYQYIVEFYLPWRRGIQIRQLLSDIKNFFILCDFFQAGVSNFYPKPKLQKSGFQMETSTCW